MPEKTEKYRNFFPNGKMFVVKPENNVAYSSKVINTNMKIFGET